MGVLSNLFDRLSQYPTHIANRVSLGKMTGTYWYQAKGRDSGDVYYGTKLSSDKEVRAVASTLNKEVYGQSHALYAPPFLLYGDDVVIWEHVFARKSVVKDFNPETVKNTIADIKKKCSELPAPTQVEKDSLASKLKL